MLVKEHELQVTFLAYRSDFFNEQTQEEILFKGKDASCLPVTASQNHPTSPLRYLT